MPIQKIAQTTLCLILLSLLCSCAWLTPASTADLPPILAQDELIRPYVNLGRIQITREVFGSDYTLTTDIRTWGYTAIRQEAAKIGADAVVLPEITGRTNTYAIIPSTEFRATGVAIKFK